MDKEVVFIGMDLGSFKTSVASSNGRRDVLQSAVGWPKDHIAEAMFGREVVFGSEIRENRLALDVVRPFEKGVLKYNDAEGHGVNPERIARHHEAASLLVEHAVNLTRPDSGAPVYGVIGAPSRATALNKQVLMEAAQKTFDVVAIVPEPFCIAYGMGCLTNALVIDIGAGTIDICPLQGTFPTNESQVTIPIGGDFVDECLGKRIAQQYPEARVSDNMIRDMKEKHGHVGQTTERALLTLPTTHQPAEFDLTDVIADACEAILEPIIDAVTQLIRDYDPEFQRALLSNVILGGGGSQMAGLDRALDRGAEGLWRR